MLRRRNHKWAAMLVAAGLLSGTVCTPDRDTTSSLVDLAAMTSGSLVQIVVKAVISGLLAGPTQPDLTAPLSDQMH